MKKADVITYAKGVAILAIVLFHLIGGYLNVNPLIIKASGFGGAGVHVFFFCSGFGLMYSQLKKPLNFTGFIKKRFLKIYIPYIIIVIISYFIPFISPNLHNRTLALLSHIFLFKMFVPNLENSLGYQFWYISTIIQFYFVFILLVKLFFKLQKKYFMILCCALSFCWAIIVTMLGYTEIRVWNSFFLQYLWEFALGMVIAGYYSESGNLLIDKISTPVLCIITVIAFGIYSVLSLKGGLLKSFNDPFSFAAISGICIILYRLKFLQIFIYFTSAISYEIYLIHILVYNTLFTVLKSFLNQYVIAAVSLILIFILSYVYNKFCKKILFK